MFEKNNFHLPSAKIAAHRTTSSNLTLAPEQCEKKTHDFYWPSTKVTPNIVVPLFIPDIFLSLNSLALYSKNMKWFFLSIRKTAIYVNERVWDFKSSLSQTFQSIVKLLPRDFLVLHSYSTSVV